MNYSGIDFDEIERKLRETQSVIAGLARAEVDAGVVPAQDAAMTDLNRNELNARLGESEAKVDARLANFDTAIKSGFAELRIEISKMQKDLHKDISDLVKWAVGLAIAIVGATVGLLGYINKSSEKPAAAPPAPIIITVPAATSSQPQATLPSSATQPPK